MTVFVRGLVNGDPTGAYLRIDMCVRGYGHEYGHVHDAHGHVHGNAHGNAYMVGSITDDGIGAARSVDGIRMQIACVSYLEAQVNRLRQGNMEESYARATVAWADMRENSA